VQKGIKDVKNSNIIAPKRTALNDISSNLQANQSTNQRGKITLTKPSISISKPTTRFASKYYLIFYIL